MVEGEKRLEKRMELGFPVMRVKEGKVSFMVPAARLEPRGPGSARTPVFYNPVMELNRDFAVLFLKAFRISTSKELEVCEPLAGCGVRGIRLAVEVGARKVVMNDLNPQAVALAQLNVKEVGVEDEVTVCREDANVFLSNHGKPGSRFDYVDVDPYGSPMPYLDSSLRALKAGGVLALTATDMAPLCGVHPKACLRRYGAKPLRTEYCHELAVRILVGAAVLTAAKMDIALQPLFTHSTDHYLRAYLKVEKGAGKADQSLSFLGYFPHCFRCLNRRHVLGLFPRLKARCENCGKPWDHAGPLWLGKLWSREILEAMSKTVGNMNLGHVHRLRRILQKIEEESRMSPGYYVVSRLCKLWSCPPPPFTQLLQNLRTLGFPATGTHFHPLGLKTEAPLDLLRKALTEA